MSRTPVDFSTDRPITSIEGDRLGRAKFAQAIADAIAGWHGEDSLVIGLHGKWGSGKTSVKNLVLRALQGRFGNDSQLVRDLADDPASMPIVVDFNPWAWSGQDRLLSAFFEEIGTALTPKSKEKGNEAAELRQRWNKYAARLSLGGNILGHLRLASEILPVPALSAALAAIKSVTEGAAETLQIAATVPDDPQESLEDLKSSVADSLRNLKRSVLVIIDDIDRMPDEELCLLFQLLRINADFPSLTYLLLCDREQVANALSKSVSGDGQKYLEKIIQISFDLPLARRADIDRVLFSDLESVLPPSSIHWERFDHDRWNMIYPECLAGFFCNLRDVRRFLPSFQFTLGMLARDGALEVNLTDLICIEAVRVFSPQTFRLLVQHRQLLLGTEQPLSLETRQKDIPRVDRISEIFAPLELADLHDPIPRLVRALFPQSRPAMEQWSRSPHVQSEWARDLRICHPDFFDRYFVFAVPDDDIPQAELEAIVAAIPDRGKCLSRLQGLLQSHDARRVLGRLAPVVEQIDAGSFDNFASVLFDVADDVEEEEERFLERGTPDKMAGLIRKLLLRMGEEKERSDRFLSALNESTGFYVPIIHARYEYLCRKRLGGHSDPLLSQTAAEEAQRISVERLNAAAREKRIQPHQISECLHAWRQLGDLADAQSFVGDLCTTLEGTLTYVNALTKETTSSQGDGKVRRSFGVRKKDLEGFSGKTVQSILAQLRPFLDGAVEAARGPLASKYEKAINALRDLETRLAEGDVDAHEAEEERQWRVADDDTQESPVG